MEVAINLRSRRDVQPAVNDYIAQLPDLTVVGRAVRESIKY
jgi:hypothetical protein